MKKVIYSLVLMLGLTGFTSCDYDGDDDTKVTHYVSIELNGGDQLTVPVGTAYKDPGFTATEGEKDVTANVQVGGDVVDANAMGIYNVVYSAVNVDGFEKSVTRQVLVCDPAVTADISGTYKVTDFSGVNAPAVGNTVKINQLAPGLYTISCWWAGIYEQTLGYGSIGCASGTFKLDKDNNITGLSGVSPFGDPFGVVTGTVDDDEIELDVDFFYHLNFTLKK